MVCLIAGLMAEGWVEPVARQHVRERFRRDGVPGDQEAGGGRCNALLPRSDQRLGSIVSHAPHTAGTWIPDAEQTFQRTEEGLQGDD